VSAVDVDRPGPTTSPGGASSARLASRFAPITRHSAPLSSGLFFVVMMAIFTIAAPSVFLSSPTYTAVFTVVPSLIVLAVGLVFVVAAGEIDLSFGSVATLSALSFSVLAEDGTHLEVALAACLLTGVAAGLLNALLVTVLKLSSLVATLGVNFLLAGLIVILRNGQGIPLAEVAGTGFYSAVVGRVGAIPADLLWALGFALLAGIVFARHRFGLRVRAVGDRADAAAATGIDVRLVRAGAFVLMGVASSLAGLFAVLTNLSFFPNTGEGFLLTALAAVFVGGTPTWGGVGTIVGAVIGAFTVAFIPTGIVAVGLTGYYTQFFYGLIIIFSLSIHSLTRVRRARGS
jgi:ribose/xylose/arabinose/galactoside ABC-type transport system permease subunit